MTDELTGIVALLKQNPRGMTVTDVSKSIRMNRNSVSKYLEMLVVSGQVDRRMFGPSKVYFISRRVPIASMLSVTSDYIIILGKDLKILYVNDKFLGLVSRKREDLMGYAITARSVPVLSHPDFRAEIDECLTGKEIVKEICIQRLHDEMYFNAKLVPMVLEDGGQGLTIILEDITERKKAEEDLRRARDELEERVIERTSELVMANRALENEIRERKHYSELSDALNGINITINSTLDYNEVMRRVVKVSAVALKCETSFIALKKNRQWVIEFSYGIPEDIAGTELPDEEVPEFAIAIDSRSTIAICDARNDPRINRNVTEKFGIRSSLLIPLVLKGEPIGVIVNNYHTVPVQFTGAEIDFGNRLGTAVALALENARRYGEKASRENRLP